MNEQHRELRELLGAYVLDQLGEPEQARVAQHVRRCADCTAEVAELEPVATALRGLDPTLPDQPAPGDLGDRVLSYVQQGQRRSVRKDRLRRAGVGLAAAASVAVAFGAGTWFAGSDDPPVIGVALEHTAPGVSASAGLVDHTWGTELKLEATGLRDGASYTVTFLDDDGAKVAAGSFLGTGAQPLRCSVNAAVDIDAAAELTVTDAAGAVVMDADLD
jgi:hypothetical protein